jgi:AcrR family transcriptional regulator
MQRAPILPRPGRQTADERRGAIVSAGVDEFAARGLSGASVDAIARRAGVSQPYVFQLFGTKKDLFIAVIRHGFERTRIAFEGAVHRFEQGDDFGVDCDTPLGAMGEAYKSLLADRTLLLVQLQAYAACSDPEVGEAVREEFSALRRYIQDASRATDLDIHAFLAEGMLLNVYAAMQLGGDPRTWTADQRGGAH